MDILFSSFSQGLIWAVMAIGVYLTYRILDIPDLTAEGSFPLGAATFAALTVAGVHPILATLGAIGAGMVAGAVSGFVHTALKIPPLLTGIITLTALYTVNLKVLGKSNVQLKGHETLVTLLDQMGWSKVMTVTVIGLVCVIAVIVLLTILMKTEIGLAIRSTGDNIHMSEANGINVSFMKVIGYMLSNGLIALSGALLAQNNNFADVNSGVGTIVAGLASIIIAEVILHNLSFGARLVTIVLGATLYRLIIAIVLEIPWMDTDSTKLVSAVLLAVILYVPEVRKALALKRPAPLTSGQKGGQ